MGKKMFYLLMTAVSFFFFTAISLALTCVMECTRTNAIIVLAVCIFGSLITIAWFDSFTKAKK